MKTIRRNAGWSTSGDVKNFLPKEIELEEEEIEYWDGTIEHLKRLGRVAASRVHYATSSKWDQVDAAISAIGIALAEDPSTTVPDLIEAGQQSISKDHMQHLKVHGQAHLHGRGTGSRFIAYWEPTRPFVSSYGLEYMALNQVWADLSDADQDILLGAAMHESSTAFAKTLGINSATLSPKIKRARQAAVNLWFDWETAPPLARRDRPRELADFCRHGHEQAIHRKWRKQKDKRKPYCGECHRIQNRKSKEVHNADSGKD